MVDDAMIGRLRAAADVLNSGDPGRLASLFADDAEWRGLPHGRFWWKRVPA
jgi:hypothetical protein